ncbi:MAG TPA: FliM/FliN family flagellar motor switch protein [Candidatus Xenobia bacterium]
MDGGGFDSMMRAAQGSGSGSGVYGDYGSLGSGRMSPSTGGTLRSGGSYDFSSGDKFSTDQQKFLQKVFQNFAEQTITLLAPLLQCRVTLELGGNIRQRTYQSFLQSLPDPTSLMVFRLDAETRGLICVEYDLTFALLDKLMGGRGQPLEEIRYFTDLERTLLQKPLVKFLEGYAEAWKEVKELKPQLASLEFNPHAVHIAPPSEMMVVVSFQTTIALTQGLVEVCLPFKHLKGIVPKASFDEYLVSRQTAQSPAPSVTPHFTKSLESAKVPVSVELGRCEVMFQDLLGLEVGDQIKLATVVGEPLRIKVNEKTKFLGHPGKRENKMAIKVTRVLTEGDEEFEE